MNEKAIIKAVSYSRFSSDHQREESIDAQQRAINEYAKKNNYLIIHEYIDRAKSARSDNRPEFLQMVEHSKKREFQVIIVDKLDRFSRNRFDSAHYKHQLKLNGVTVVSVKENLDGSPESVIMESVLEGFAEYYSLNLARESMKGLKENAYQTKATGGTSAYGFRINPETKLLEINENEAPAVRLIFKRLLEGIGYSAISEELYNLGYKNRKGKIFSPSTICTMAENHKYCGIFTYNKSASKDASGKRNGHAKKDESEWIMVRGGCPEIISEEDFNEVQRMKKHSKEAFKNHRKVKEYLLSGKVFCGICGERFFGESRFDKRINSEYILYVCSSKRKHKDLKCTSTSIHRDKLEFAVLKILSDEIFCTEMEERVIQYYNQYLIGVEQDLKDHVTMIKNKIKGNETALDGVLDAITQVRSEALFGKLAYLEDEKAKLQALLKDAEQKVSAKKVSAEEIKVGFSFAKELLKSRNLPNCQKIIEKFVDRVEIFDDGIYVKLNFSKFRKTPPPNPYRDLPIKDQVHIARGIIAAPKEHFSPAENNAFSDKNKMSEENIKFSSDRNGGEGGIRTLDELLTHTRVPVVRHKPG